MILMGSRGANYVQSFEVVEVQALRCSQFGNNAWVIMLRFKFKKDIGCVGVIAGHVMT